MLIAIELDNYTTFSERTMYSFTPGQITLHKNKLFFTSSTFLYKSHKYHILHPMKIIGSRLYIDTYPDFARKKKGSFIIEEAYRIPGFEKYTFDGFVRLFNFLFEDSCHYARQIHKSFITFLLEFSGKALFKVDLDKSGHTYTFTLHNNLLLVSDITFTEEEISVENTKIYSISGKRCLYEFACKDISIRRYKSYLHKDAKILLNQILQREVGSCKTSTASL